MSDWIYAAIPYKRSTPIVTDNPYPYENFPFIPELQGMGSEFAERDGLQLYEDFLLINLCYKEPSFINCQNGYSWIRSEVYKVAQRLGAKEVWYVMEMCTQEMAKKDFSFEDWKHKLQNERKQYTAEMSIDVLKGDILYSYYHDSFSDIILESPSEI